MADLGAMKLDAALDAIAARTPTPGGGATAAITGALAAAQARMVVAYSIGKKSLAEHEPVLRDADARLARSREALMGLAAEDAEAFALVQELTRLPAGDRRREAELPAAVEAATRVPLVAAAGCVAIVRLARDIAPICNAYLLSDLAIAAILADGAARASAENVRVNLPALAEHAGAEKADEASAEIGRLLADSAALLPTAVAACRRPV